MISIIIPTLGRPTLDSLLRSIGELKARNPQIEFEVFAVTDQAVSLDAIASRLRALNCDWVRLLPSSGLGVNCARNTGARASRFDILWFLDDDTEVASFDALEKILEAFADQALVAAGGEYRSRSNANGDVHGYNALCSTWRASAGSDGLEWLLGGSLVVRRSSWEQVGGFDEQIVYGGAETPFVMRLRAIAGAKTLFLRALNVWHNPSGRSFVDWMRVAYLQGQGKRSTGHALPDGGRRAQRAIGHLKGRDLKTLWYFGLFSVPFLLASRLGSYRRR
jgi:GT2 family glycosyltransferase